MFKRIGLALLVFTLSFIAFQNVRASTTYTVSYYLDGELYATETVSEGDPAPNLAPTAPGQSFDKWYQVNASAWNFSFGVFGDFNLYGRWTDDPNLISILLNPEGGVLGGAFTGNWGDTISNRILNYAGDLLPVPPDPTRTGYTFEYWYELVEVTPGNFVVVEINFATYSPTTNKTIRAMWEEVPAVLDQLEVPTYTMIRIENTEVDIEICNSNGVAVNYTSTLLPFIVSESIPANDCITITLVGLTEDTTYELRGELSDPGFTFDNSDNASITFTTIIPVEVTITYDDTRGTVEVDGVLVLDGAVLLVYPGEELIIEAIPGLDVEFLYFSEFSELFGGVFINDNPYTLNILEDDTFIDINAVFGSDPYPGYIVCEVTFTTRFETILCDNPEYFTISRLSNAIIYINDVKAVEQGQVTDLFINELKYNVIIDTSKPRMQVAELGFTVSGGGWITFRYGNAPAALLLPEAFQGEISNVGFEDTLPMTVLIYLKLDDPVFTPPLSDIEGGVNIPSGFEGLLTGFGLWNIEGILLFFTLLLLAINIGLILILPNPSLIFMIDVVIVLLFVFMNLLPFYAIMALGSLFAFIFVLIFRGGMIYE